MTAPLPHPGVRFPPPLLFVAGFAAGALLHRYRPLGLPEALAGRPALAWTLVALGLGLVLWAMATFQRAHTAIIPNRPASEVVARGPYRFSRNPMYVGMSVAYAGLALWLGSLWPLLLLPVVLGVLYRTVIRREERYLTAAFGAPYAAYTRRVRRWL